MTARLSPLPDGPAGILLEDGLVWLPESGARPLRGSLAIGRHGAAEFVPIENEVARRARTGPATRVVALEGRTVTPGLHDAHIHVSEGGISLLRVDCRDARSEEEVAARAAGRARLLGPGKLVTGRGWDHHLFPGERWPRRATLDRACPENPVMLRRIDGHAAWANASALALVGFTRDTADPPGGKLGRDPETGDLDGLLFENAIDVFMDRTPPPDEAEREAGLLEAVRRLRKVGVTRVDDERGWPEVYARLHERGELSVRARIWHRLKTPIEELRAAFLAFARLGEIHERGLVRPGLLKGYLDGSLGSRTAWFWEPYADDASTCGISTFDPEELHRRVVAADAAGFQVGLHAIGDRAVTLALDAYEAARRANGPRGARHRVEHAQNVRDRDVPRFAAQGTVASMQPSHKPGDAAFFRQRLGPAREAGAYAWRRLLDAGAPVALGSDFPVESMDPRTSLAPAVAGCLSVHEALQGFTTGAAWAGFLEHEPWRDFAVWGGDLLSMDAEALARVPCDMTIFDGRVVHEAG